jgi:AcrR family transcriptional regulator
MTVQGKISAPPIEDACVGKLRSAKDRIFQAASELFYRKGIQAVGVDAIAEEASTTKMSLYRHFSSKDELVAAWLRDKTAHFQATWQKIRTEYPGDPRAQLHAFFVRVAEYCADPSSRGCPAANAAVELTDPDHPARKIIEEHKVMIRVELTKVCTELGIADPGGLGDALFLLMEGARSSTQTLGHQGPACAIVKAADALIDSHLRMQAAIT